MWVTVKILNEIGREFLDKTFCVQLIPSSVQTLLSMHSIANTYRCASMIQVCLAFQLWVFPISEVLHVVWLHVFCARF